MGADDDKTPKKPLGKRRLIKYEELAKHNTEDDCWVAIHGLVIKVDQKLKNDHPGGPEVIFALGGKDVTEDFEDIGHSDAAREWTDELVIGYLDEEKKEAWVPRTSTLAGSGSIGVFPIIIAVAIAIGAYMYTYGQ